MTAPAASQPGLRIGLICLAIVTLGFVSVFTLGPDRETQSAPEDPAPAGVLDILGDPQTRSAIEGLRAISPATYARLNSAAMRAVLDGAEQEDVAQLVLEALFSQFQTHALTLRGATSANYHAIIVGLSEGLAELKRNQSPWCEGPQIAEFLTQNEDELVPVLLRQFPYQSPQYDWAMSWMATIFVAVKQAQDAPRRHQRPGFRDEAVLQQEGLAFGSEQWALALQIASFANAEGTSYGQMQEVIGNMNVCDLGVAVETVSDRLPDDVRARIWADLMPEIMVGNTPYVMWRVTDYFFIG